MEEVAEWVELRLENDGACDYGGILVGFIGGVGGGSVSVGE
jgi:hypothetical protein